MKLKTYQKIEGIKSPIMLAAWPGVGNVGIRAVDYLRRKLKLEPLAEIEAPEFTIPEAVIVDKGHVQLPLMPRNMFYYKKSSSFNLIVFEGEVQLRPKPTLLLIDSILKFAKDLGVKTIFTAAAFPVPMRLEEPPKVYSAGTTKKLRDLMLNEYQLKPLDMGEIVGANGLLVGQSEQYDIPAACLLSTIPAYAIGFPNPQASRAIVKVFEQILKIKVNLSEIDLQIQELVKDLSEIRKHIKEQFYDIGQEETTNDKEEEVIPFVVRKKIEQLFYEAKNDKKKAYMLKEELDKWNLFNLYEDRFLDLFKTK
ncbi:MAG: PAC2 family protein [bacterium]|nr:PAC2 family protein [bacterium]